MQLRIYVDGIFPYISKRSICFASASSSAMLSQGWRYKYCIYLFMQSLSLRDSVNESWIAWATQKLAFVVRSVLCESTNLNFSLHSKSLIYFLFLNCKALHYQTDM